MGGFERTRNVAATSVIPPEPIVDVTQTLLGSSSLTPQKLSRDGAKQMGFTGNQCNVCFGMRMRISGHCEVCEECGNSSGCS
jgi:hypothetical protein